LHNDRVRKISSHIKYDSEHALSFEIIKQKFHIKMSMVNEMIDNLATSDSF
jgi:hypothetical protein